MKNAFLASLAYATITISIAFANYHFFNNVLSWPLFVLNMIICGFILMYQSLQDGSNLSFWAVMKWVGIDSVVTLIAILALAYLWVAISPA